MSFIKGSFLKYQDQNTIEFIYHLFSQLLQISKFYNFENYYF